MYGVTLGLLLITVLFDGTSLARIFRHALDLIPSFEVLIIRVLYRYWWAFRHVQTKSAVSLSDLLRVMAFSFYRIVVAVYAFCYSRF